jgi:hypothetical protein
MGEIRHGRELSTVAVDTDSTCFIGSQTAVIGKSGFGAIQLFIFFAFVEEINKVLKYYLF